MATDGVTPFEARVNALYASPLDEFVANRKRLADELKREGAAADARRFGALAKPTLSAWLTNQTVRHAPALMQELLSATDVVAAAQRKLPGSKDFAAAVAGQRKILEQLAAHAQDLGAKLGPAGADVLDRVTNNFRWGAIPGPEREALAQGRLIRDVAAPGFGGFGDLADDDAERLPRRAPRQEAPSSKATGHAGHAKSSPPSDSKTDAHRKAEAARAAAQTEREHKQSVARHKAALREAQRETTQARRNLERAERDHTVADHRVTAAEAELASAKSARDAAEEQRQAAATELASREAAEEKLHRTAPRPEP